MKPETVEIRKLYEEEYIRLNAKYAFQKPELQVTHYAGGSQGLYYAHRNLVKINSISCLHYRGTIIHELCHAINALCFPVYRKNQKTGQKKLVRYAGHNPQFWKLCYEFGLKPEEDYAHGETGNMKRGRELYERSGGL